MTIYLYDDKISIDFSQHSARCNYMERDDFPMNSNTVLRVQGLTVRYKDIVAVDNVSFEITQGEIFGIIGPNGAGKTSVMECLEGLRKPTGGAMDVLGIPPANRRELYRHIGVQLQEASFPDDIKVEELCRMFSSFYDTPADYRVLLETFELADKKNAYVKKLSGGQKQKISIVMALIANPRIVFLDELTTGLDPKARIGMWALIRHLRDEGKTIVMTTHYMDEAEALCDRICMMVKGKISAIGAIRELVELAKIEQRISFSSAAAGKESLQSLPGVSHVTVRGQAFDLFGNGANFQRDIVRYLTENNIDFDDLSSTKPGLEEVFLVLTGTRLEETA